VPVSARTRRLVVRQPPGSRAAQRAVDLPIARLLDTAPDLDRYFVNGRLMDLTVDHARDRTKGPGASVRQRRDSER